MRIGKIKDLTGQRFGRLTVIKIDEEKTKYNKEVKHIRNITWLCKCDCGNYVSSLGGNLTRGNVKSCGCLAAELASKRKIKQNKFNLSGDYGIGYTSKGKEFYFDLEDYEKIKDYCWYIDKKGYVRAKVKGIADEIHLLHRLVCNIENTFYQVDHINGKRNDDRKSNLRISNIDGLNKNSINKAIQKNNTSGCPGVMWHKRDAVWESWIGYDNKRIYLGRFHNYDDAVKVRKQAEEKYFKEWSYDKSRGGVAI